jgi:hypothetical protein
LFFSTAVFFFPHYKEIMAQSARAAGKGQRQGRNAVVSVAPPLLQLHLPLAVFHLLKLELQVNLLMLKNTLL